MRARYLEVGRDENRTAKDIEKEKPLRLEEKGEMLPSKANFKVFQEKGYDSQAAVG